MPGIDPFTVTFEEKSNFASAIERFTHQIPIGMGTRAMSMLFRRERRVFGSSDGAFTTQIVYLVDARFDYMSRPNHKLGTAVISAPFVTPTGAGWEYIRDIPARTQAEEMLDFVMRAREEREADVGRYDLVLDPISAANFMASSLGPATELTRAMGYYANTEGTSYLTDPLTILHDGMRVASPLVTVTTDRAMPRGAATVRWDDEGVAPAETSIVTHGILSGFQTTRESAAWINEAARSTGCAGTFGATMPTSQVSPNMTITPGNNNVTLLDLVKGVKKGILVYGATFSGDHQFVSGTSRNAGAMFEIKNGVVGSALSNAKLLYRSPEFWAHVEAIGGPASARLVGIETRRGESTTGSAYHTINAVPMLITGAAVTNEWRPRA
jgi:TldD protein